MTNQIARKFAEQAGFRIDASKSQGHKDGGFWLLHNHLDGTPIRRREPIIDLYLVNQYGSKDGMGFRGDFVFHGKETGVKPSTQTVTAHPNGTVSGEFSRLTPLEIALVMKHVGTLHRLMKKYGFPGKRR